VKISETATAQVSNDLPKVNRSRPKASPGRLIFMGSLLDEATTLRWALALAAEFERHGAAHMHLRIASMERPVSGLRRMAAQASETILLVKPEDAAYLRCRLFERSHHASFIPVICAGDEPLGNLPGWLRRYQPIIVRGNEDAGVRAVTRRVLKCRVGLALSAGSAKGLAHIGVIQVLEEHGIEIDAVAGVSMGAYVGACWCYGHNGEALEALAATIKTRKDVLSLTDPVFPPRRGFIRGLKARERVAESIKHVSFDELVRPLHLVLTDLDTLGATIISEGDVASAVHASLAIPGICEPVTLNGRRYTDGGTSDPLPVTVLEDLGIERIIAVNTQPSLTDLEALAMDQGKPDAKRWAGALKASGMFLNKQLNYFANGNLLDTVMRGLQAAQVRLIETSGRRADVFIHAYPIGTRWYAFDAYAAAIETGRSAALAQLQALKNLQCHRAS
jgi:NTE family protein